MYLKVIDNGNSFTILEVLEDYKFNIDPAKFIYISFDNAELFAIINQAIMNKQKVFLTKNHSLNLKIADFEFTNPNMDIDLTIEKSLLLRNARFIFNSRISLDFFFDLFNFMVLNNQLLDKGFTVTDKDREDQYIDIINSGDMDLIDILQNYLTSLDDIKHSYAAYRFFTEFKSNLEEADTIEEANEIYKQFDIRMADFNVIQQ